MRIGGILSVSGDRIGSLGIRLIGPFLLVILFFLLGFMTFVYFSEVLPYIILEFGAFFSMFVTSVGVLVLMNVVYNYLLCVWIGPGHPSESLDLPICKQCKGPKPLRAHHCSVCNKCVLKMDHHCPWIMNCVGHTNHRYFLLFLFYLTLGAFFMASVSFSRHRNGPKNKNVNLCFILACVFSVILLGFTAWHFFLACVGSTTIEIFKYYSQAEDRDRFNFSRGSYRKNLETVFGTSSLWKIFLPSSEKLPFDGVNWPDTLHSI